MKVFHPLLHYYPSQVGGPANSIFWLNEALKKNQIETIVLSSNIGIDLRNNQKFMDLSDVKYINYNFFECSYYI